MIDVIQKTDLDGKFDTTTTDFIGSPTRGQNSLNVKMRAFGSSNVSTPVIQKVDTGYEEEVEKKDAV